MNEIQKERLRVLEEATRRMREDDYQEMPFADRDKLIYLFKARNNWYKELKSGTILISGTLSEEKKHNNEIIEKENQRIKDTYIKPLEFKISVLEVESMLFSGLFEMTEISEDINIRVYGKES
jgi:hypothetical protein